ncbi:MAG: hypothetical protein ACLTGU_21425, partial [Escherichia coli]
MADANLSPLQQRNLPLLDVSQNCCSMVAKHLLSQFQSPKGSRYTRPLIAAMASRQVAENR